MVIKGGGNDIGDVCGTAGESAVLERMVSADGQRGAMPDYARDLRASGAYVIWLGCYPISVAGGPFVPCRATLDLLKARQMAIATALDGVIFVDTAEVIAPDNIDLFASDLVHTSVQGAARIGVQLADVVRFAPMTG